MASWEAVSRAGLFPPYLLPGPEATAIAMWRGLSDGSLLLASGASMARLLGGFGTALLLGVVLGLVIGTVDVLDEGVGTVLLGLQSIPSIAWLPLALLWFGLDQKAIIFIIFIGSFIPVIQGTITGVKQVPELLRRVGRVMGAKGLFYHRTVVFPASLPSIVTGARMGWSFGWRSLLAGELLVSGVGLGQVLEMGRNLSDMEMVLSVMIVIAALGIVLERLVFARIERSVTSRWGLEGE